MFISAPHSLLILLHFFIDNMLYQVNELFWLPGNKVENSRGKKEFQDLMRQKANQFLLLRHHIKEVNKNRTG